MLALATFFLSQSSFFSISVALPRFLQARVYPIPWKLFLHGRNANAAATTCKPALASYEMWSLARPSLHVQKIPPHHTTSPSIKHQAASSPNLSMPETIIRRGPSLQLEAQHLAPSSCTHPTQPRYQLLSFSLL
ncbi:hypothetical protein GGI43DRAFT_389389 [Trichoderma evansii]